MFLSVQASLETNWNWKKQFLVSLQKTRVAIAIK